jgi:hypothetical protein
MPTAQHSAPDTQPEALFDVAEPAIPIRKASRDYLLSVAGDYGGLRLWALAPIDRYVRELHYAPADSSDFVWLVDELGPHWALVDLAEHKIIALDPDRIDKSIWEAA